jgi:hypothetical protein
MEGGGRGPPAGVSLGHLWRVHGLLDFVREPIEVTVQTVEEVSLGFVRREIPDQRSLGRFLP